MVPIKLLKKMVDDSKHGVLVILEIYKIMQMHCNCTIYCSRLWQNYYRHEAGLVVKDSGRARRVD
jgi:hypothetical protein